MRGLKPDITNFIKNVCVASFTDAWIETSSCQASYYASSVASFTDAWIETPQQGIAPLVGLVASFTDAWIETDRESARSELLCRIFYRCVD